MAHSREDKVFKYGLLLSQRERLITYLSVTHHRADEVLHGESLHGVLVLEEEGEPGVGGPHPGQEEGQGGHLDTASSTLANLSWYLMTCRTKYSKPPGLWAFNLTLIVTWNVSLKTIARKVCSGSLN